MNEPDNKQIDTQASLTIPNVICGVRLVGAFVLVGIAVAGLRYWFVGLYIALMLTDFVDGKLARWMKQRSVLGARLDSLADALLTFFLLVGVGILSWEALQPEWIWLSVAFASYLVSSLYGFSKYGRMPAYHTNAAKVCQLLTLIAAITFVLGWSVWPLRVAAVTLMLTNLEAIAITRLLERWQADVPSVFHAKRLQNDQNESFRDGGTTHA